MADLQAKAIHKILITQPKPESDKSPYFELSRKFCVELDFHPFIRLEGISSKDFRKQKIEIPKYSAVVFTSRNAIDHFFRICEELKINVHQNSLAPITKARTLRVGFDIGPNLTGRFVGHFHRFLQLLLCLPDCSKPGPCRGYSAD